MNKEEDRRFRRAVAESHLFLRNGKDESKGMTSEEILEALREAGLLWNGKEIAFEVDPPINGFPFRR